MSECVREMTDIEKIEYLINMIKNVEHPILVYQWEKDFVRKILEEKADYLLYCGYDIKEAVHNLSSEILRLKDEITELTKLTEKPITYDMDKIINQLQNKMFSAECYNDEFNGCEISNLLCMGDVYEILTGGEI